jgi:hypothetical protein
MKRKTKTNKQPNYLFTIRVWAEKLGDENPEWRGKISNVLKDQSQYFRGWEGLVEILQSFILEIEEENG